MSVEDSSGNEDSSDDGDLHDETSSFRTGELIIAHSKVYKFADQFFCSKLKSLALHYLTLILQSPESKLHNIIPALTDATRYICENTQNEKENSDPARALLMQSLVEN